MGEGTHDPVPRFERRFFAGPDAITRIADGELGGKASGLVRARDLLARAFPEGRVHGFAVGVPRMAVLATGAFEAFLERNRLAGVLAEDLPDDRVALAFQQADIPVEVLGDLRALVEEVRTPLAVRSSSRLEDARLGPFAGVFATKMIPNHDPAADARFRRLTEAIKLVWASTYFAEARAYRAAAGVGDADERMAVVVQDVVGLRHGDRYYPDVSAVARTVNFYPTGRARREEGVVELALGLGKTIVDGEAAWTYSPAWPKAPPPFGSARDVVRQTQNRFWAVDMSHGRPHDPIAETEFLARCGLEDADYDGTLARTASTWDARSDRLSPGVGAEGTRVLTFAPLLLLRDPPLNDAVAAVLRACEEALGEAVEIELAATFERGAAPRLGFLQVRPMVVAAETVEIAERDLADPALLVVSHRAMGNGVEDGIRDVVYVRPETFETRHTRAAAAEIERLNAALVAAGRPYVLIGFGRWGSADPWLGIPVDWARIRGARVIVESTAPGLDVEPSQGSHFFHNLTSFRVSYLWVRHDASPPIDWAWLDALPAATEGALTRHVRLDRALAVRVDGRSGVGAIWRRPPGAPPADRGPTA